MAFCFLFDVAHCSKYCWLNFFLCKQVSWVWQPWRSLWWNVLRQSSLGLPISLPKELGMCGATSWLLLVLSASTCAWSRLALHMLGIWCLSCKKLWRETSGMWRMKGGLFQMRRASKSWRSVLQSFALRPRFGRLECTSGKQMMCRAEPPTQKRGKSHSGKGRASWFAHTMRCSCGTTARIASLGLNCFLAGRSDACGVCVCVELQAFCIFGLNCLLAGRSDALRAMTFDRRKVVMDITFAAWCEVNIEFAELLFFVKLWTVDVRFWFWYVRKNVRRYVRKHVKRYVRKNVKRYVRKNVKRYVRKNVRR